MSGTVLIVDDMATNRIVLKVRLAPTPNRVVQAASAREALRLAATGAPDLILANTRLDGQSAEPFLRALRRIGRLAHVPVLMMQDGECAAERQAMLRAGADDILAGPVPEALLLARLRSLLRAHHAEAEIAAQAGDAAGFAEPRAGIALPGRVAIFGPDRAATRSLRSLLGGCTAHRLTSVAPEATPPPVPQDVLLLRIAGTGAEAGLHLLADLKTARDTGRCPVLVLLDRAAAPLAVTLLDMGADDVILAPADAGELALRIDRQIGRKRRIEAMRGRVRSGMAAALRDPLTGAYNRRHALPWLERQLAPARPGRNRVAVMLADLDFFKRVNDRHGHAAGDAVLCAVTERLGAHLRAGDLLARIGGEEFLVALPDASPARARRVAERLCDAIRATPIAVPGVAAPIPVTLSIGVTVVQTGPGQPAPDMQTVLEQADSALYAAKAQGRNQASFCARSAA
ncbi:diguanylate cyclase [Roseovarius ramblicola]|uniref:diguanylate cyclase n=1 Tax=Roseovarius ramblicola TaxID=2022336 RepID=A0ABV5HXU7_9RHOB